MPPKLYSVRDAAAYLGLKPETIKYHVYSSHYLKGQLVGKTIVFTQEELDDFARTVPKPGRKKGSHRDEEPPAAEEQSPPETDGKDE